MVAYGNKLLPFYLFCLQFPVYSSHRSSLCVWSSLFMTVPFNIYWLETSALFVQVVLLVFWFFF